MEIYYVYRNLYPQHRKSLLKSNLQVDLTLIFPQMLGIEYAKTLGHVHSIHKSLSYSELYQVIQGQAWFLFQKSQGDQVLDVVLVKASPGDQVIMPPGYAHVTINPGNTTLKLLNIVSRDCSADYQPILRYGGACYFLTTQGPIMNTNYSKIPPLRELKASFRFESIPKMLKDPAKLSQLDFLNNPEEHPWLLELYR